MPNIVKMIQYLGFTPWHSVPDQIGAYLSVLAGLVTSINLIICTWKWFSVDFDKRKAEDGKVS